MARIGAYMQLYNSLLVNGVPISGFAEGDWWSVKPEGGACSRTKGGKGPTLNYSVSQGGIITLNLMPTSAAIGPLYALRQAQQVAPVPFTIQLFSGVSELILAEGCGFGELDSFAGGGPAASARKFTFECVNIVLDPSLTIPLAPANIIP